VEQALAQLQEVPRAGSLDLRVTGLGESWQPAPYSRTSPARLTTLGPKVNPWLCISKCVSKEACVALPLVDTSGMRLERPIHPGLTSAIPL